MEIIKKYKDNILYYQIEGFNFDEKMNSYFFDEDRAGSRTNYLIMYL